MKLNRKETCPTAFDKLRHDDYIYTYTYTYTNTYIYIYIYEHSDRYTYVIVYLCNMFVFNQTSDVMLNLAIGLHVIWAAQGDRWRKMLQDGVVDPTPMASKKAKIDMVRFKVDIKLQLKVYIFLYIAIVAITINQHDNLLFFL